MTQHIFLIGFMGTGKSTVGRALAEKTGCPLVDTDSYIEEATKRSIPEIFETEGEDAFRKLERKALSNLAQGSPKVISCGGGIIKSEENISLMKETGKTVLLSATAETVYKRVCHNENRPLLQGKKNPAAISILMEERRTLYEKARDYTVQTDGKNPSEIASEILDLLGGIDF